MSGATTKYSPDLQIPAELPALIKEFTREVLREQPQSVYKFGAEFFARKAAEAKASTSSSS